MDAESVFSSQYSTNWTTSPLPDPPTHSCSSTPSTPNLSHPHFNSSSASVMLNSPIPRASPSMSHQISAPGDSHNPLQSFTSSELSNVFSAPLDPDTFAALAASGMLPPPLSQPLHPSSESIRNPYAVHSSPFLSTSPPHIVDVQYPSKLSYSHTIPNPGPQIKAKQTIVRRIACFLSSLLYFPLRRSSNLIRRSLTFTLRATTVLHRCRIDLSMLGLLTHPPLSQHTTSSPPPTAPVITPNVLTPGCPPPYGCPLPQLPHLLRGSLTRYHIILSAITLRLICPLMVYSHPHCTRSPLPPMSPSIAPPRNLPLLGYRQS